MRINFGTLPGLSKTRFKTPTEAGQWLENRREQACAKISQGALAVDIARRFSDDFRLVAQSWLNTAIQKSQAPVPLCFVQLGSTARGEALPGQSGSSDIDYLVLNGAPYQQESKIWTRTVHEELQKRANAHGFEFCDRLNGLNYFDTMGSWFARSDKLFDGGNLFTAEFLGGDREVFKQIAEHRARFHRDEGNPNSEYSFQRPLRMRFTANSLSSAAKQKKEVQDVILSIRSGRQLPLRWSQAFFKQLLQVSVITMQSLAVINNLSAQDTAGRIKECGEKGILHPSTADRAMAAFHFSLQQKANSKIGLPLASRSDAIPHLESCIALLDAHPGGQQNVRQKPGYCNPTDTFERV